MRFAAIVGTVDEVDLLPRQIEHLRRIGVDLIIVLEHGSTDGTLELLAVEEQADDLWVVHAPPGVEGLRPQTFNGRRSRIRAALARASEATWVLFLDSDEFWLPATGNLRDLAELEAADVLSVMRYNVVLGPEGPELPERIVPESYADTLVHAQPVPAFYAYLQQHPEARLSTGYMEPKVMCRPEAIGTLQTGDHDVDGTPGQTWRRGVARDLVIAHAQFRTYERFERRVRNVRDSLARLPDFSVGNRAWQWRRWAEAAERDRTREEFEHERVGGDELEALRASGAVRSVAELFERLVPRVTSESTYRSMSRGAQPWISAAADVCRRHQIALRARLVVLPGTDQPTVRVRGFPDCVIRFYGPWADGMAARERELAALAWLSDDPELPAPRLMAEGALDDEWRYVVVSAIRGRPLAEVVDELGMDELAGIATGLAGFVARLHRVPVPAAARVAGLAAFRARMAERYRALLEQTARPGGMPLSLARRLAAWLPPLGDLLDGDEEGALVHGRLDVAHVFVALDKEQRRHVVTGAVGFSASAIGPPLYDLGPLAWSLLSRDPSLVSAFHAAAGSTGWPALEWPQRALAWAMLNPASDEVRWPDVETTTSLDELAWRWFGSAAATPIVEAVRTP